MISSGDKPILFYNSDHYIKNCYTISKTDYWETLFNSKITFQIVSSSYLGYEEITIYSSHCLEDEAPKEISGIEFEVEGYALSNHNDIFIFEPLITAYYKIDTTNEFNITYNGEELLNNEGYYLLDKGKKYTITVNGISSGVFNLNISILKVNNKNFLIESNKEIFYKIDIGEIDLYNLRVENSKSITILNEQLLVIEVSNGYVFLKSGIYYVGIIKNDNQHPILELLDIDEVNLNSVIENQINENYYYKFKVTSSDYYYIFEFNSNNLYFYYHGSLTNPSYIVSSEKGINRYKMYLSQGEILYLGYRISDPTNTKFTIVKSNDNFVSWYQDGNKISKDYIVMKQGTSTNITAKITNIDITQELSIQSLNVEGIEFNPTTGKLDVLNNAMPTAINDGPYSLLIAFDDDIYYLNIYVIVDISVSLSKYDASEVSDLKIQNGVTININTKNPSDTFEVYLKIVYKDGFTTTQTLNVYSNQGYNFSLNVKDFGVFLGDDVYTVYTRAIAEFSIEKLYYIQNTNVGSRKLLIYNSNYHSISEIDSSFKLDELEVNTMYDSGSGSSADPYIITSAKHFNNLRYMLAEFREGSDSYYYVKGYYESLFGCSFDVQFETLPTLKKCYINFYESSISFANNEKPIFSKIIDSSINNIYFYKIKITKIPSKTDFDDVLYMGCLANYIVNSTIDGCRVYLSSINISDGDYSTGYVGGFIGMATTSVIKNCVGDVEITSTYNIGGICGYSYSSKIDSCQSGVEITMIYNSKLKNQAAGGFVGISLAGSITNCYFTPLGIIRFTSNDPASYDDKELKPCVGYMVGIVRNNTELSYTELLGELDSGPLRSWWSWFVTYNQLEYFREAEYGKTE